MRYRDFVDLRYEPSETDVVCCFRVETAGIDIDEAAGAVAAESSIGTWTELSTVKPYVLKLAAHVFSIESNTVRIAYPLQLFELGSMPNILSSVAGNVFGLRALKCFSKWASQRDTDTFTLPTERLRKSGLT